MKRATLRYLPPSLLAGSLTLIVLAMAVASTGCGGSSGSSTTTPPPPPPNLSVVKHIIFLAEENRSFDSYFGKMNDYRSAAPYNLPRAVNGLPDDCSPTTGGTTPWTTPCSAMNLSPNAQGVPTTPVYAFKLQTACIDGLSPDWIVGHWDFNVTNPSSNTPGTLGLPTPGADGFVVSAASAAIGNGENDVQGIRAMGYYTGGDIPYHYWLATNFAMSDNWFAPAATRTQPNRYYLMGATSGGYAYPYMGGIEPPIQSKTIFDSLQAANVSWKVYTELPDGYTYASVFNGFMDRFGSTGNVVNDPSFSQFLSDAQSGNLASVTFIDKPDADEKPDGTAANVQDGVAETEQLINAVMNGPEWSSTVLIFTFDEAGGLYDHVVPPTNVPSPDGIKPVDLCTGPTDPGCTFAALTHSTPPYDPPGDFTRYGFRIPVVVISPFAKAGYVSHVQTDSSAWLKLVEERFSLQPLNARDGWSGTSDMSDFFDFANPPWTTPPANPPSDGPGNCYDSLP